MDKPSPPSPRKRPSQSRSLLLVKAIQDSCLKVLREEGPEKLTTQRIADVAGINIASFYQYYPNKEAVLAELFEEQIQDYTAQARERFASIEKLSRLSLRDTLRAIIDMEVEQRLLLHSMDPDFYTAYLHSFDIHRRVNDLTISLDNPSWQDWFPRFLGYHRESLRDGELELMSQVARHALEGALLAALAEQPELLRQSSFKQELLTLLTSYLLKPGASGCAD